MRRVRVRCCSGGKFRSFWERAFKSGLIRKTIIYFLCMGGFSTAFLSLNISVYANEQILSADDEIPRELVEYFDEVGQDFQICPELLEAIAWHESRFEPDVKNGSHYGLMQVNVKIHKNRIQKYGWTAKDMLDPYKNIVVAADYLSELFGMFGGDDYCVLLHYSGGWKAVHNYEKYGTITEYVKEILYRSEEYERMHDKKRDHADT